jgi:hypothetical protein
MSEPSPTFGFDDVNEVKKAFENILGAIIEIEFTSSNEQGKQLFISVIEDITKLTSQNDLIFDTMGVDLNSITDPYVSIIEKLLVLHFGEEAFNIIVWYLSQQLNPEVKAKLEDKDGNTHTIDTPEQLWEFLISRFFSE